MAGQRLPRSGPTGTRPHRLSHGAKAAPGQRRLNPRYSRFVHFMKIALPVAAMGLIALMAAWPSLHNTGMSRPSERDVGRLEMLNARFFSIDKGNQPFSVIAESAVQSTNEPGVFVLTRPEAEMTETDGSWVFLKSNRGRFDQNKHQLTMTEHVVVRQDDGYEFVTDQAFVHVKNGTAWGKKPVVGQGPFGEIAADGFRIVDKGRTMVFSGTPAMTLPHAAGSSALVAGTASPPVPASSPTIVTTDGNGQAGHTNTIAHTGNGGNGANTEAQGPAATKSAPETSGNAETRLPPVAVSVSPPPAAPAASTEISTSPIVPAVSSSPPESASASASLVPTGLPRFSLATPMLGVPPAPFDMAMPEVPAVFVTSVFLPLPSSPSSGAAVPAGQTEGMGMFVPPVPRSKPGKGHSHSTGGTGKAGKADIKNGKPGKPEQRHGAGTATAAKARIESPGRSSRQEAGDQ